MGQSSFRFVFRIFCGVVVALGGITQHPLGLWLANLLGIGAQVLVTRGVCWRMFPFITMSPDDWVGSTARPKRSDNGDTW